MDDDTLAKMNEVQAIFEDLNYLLSKNFDRKIRKSYEN